MNAGEKMLFDELKKKITELDDIVSRATNLLELPSRPVEDWIRQLKRGDT